VYELLDEEHGCAHKGGGEYSEGGFAYPRGRRLGRGGQNVPAMLQNFLRGVACVAQFWSVQEAAERVPGGIGVGLFGFVDHTVECLR